MKYFYFIILFSLSLFAKETIVWNTVEFPPSLITKGENKDQGYSDKARILVSKTVTEYKHKLKYVNSARAISNIKEKSNHCFSGLNKNPTREKFIEFSDFFMLSLPNEIVIKKNNYNKFLKFIDSNGLINFEKLLTNQDFNFAYTKNRSYNPYIDEIIEKNRNKKNILYRPASDLTNGFLNMLRENRADYIIEYPTMVAYHSSNEFITIPIKNANTPFPVYIGCSKTNTGKKIIQRINTVIKNNKNLLNSFYASHLDNKTKARYLNSVQE